MEKPLSKKISDTFKSPISKTNCGHSFCKECLLAACPESSDWLCPQCRTVHYIPAPDLTRNFVAEQMFEFFREQELNLLVQNETEIIKAQFYTSYYEN